MSLRRIKDKKYDPFDLTTMWMCVRRKSKFRNNSNSPIYTHTVTYR